MIRCDQRAVPRAPAAEHGQAEHGSQDSCVISFCANGIVALVAICALASAIQLVILSGSPAKSKISRICRGFGNGGSSTSLGMTENMYRTHDCNSLRKSDIGEQVTMAGWVNVTRDHGGVIFIDLRDRAGLTQVVFRPEEFPQVAAASHGLRHEDVIQITGRVVPRLANSENSKL